MAPTQSSKVLEAYSRGGNEGWNRDHKAIKTCFDLEDTLAWGVRIFRGLTESDARLQARIIRDNHPSTTEYIKNMAEMYELWVSASRHYLDEAKQFVAEGYEIEGLEEFQVTLEEARCLVENLGLEDALPSIEELTAQARPDNPDAGRYGD